MKTTSIIVALVAARLSQADDVSASRTIRASRKIKNGEYSSTSVKYPVQRKTGRKLLSENHVQLRKDALERHLSFNQTANVDSQQEATFAGQERSGLKSKADLGKLMWNDDGFHSVERPIDWADDTWSGKPDWSGSDTPDDTWWGGGKSDKGSDDWSGGGSGKSDKGSDDWSGGGSGKSDKGSDDWTGGDSGKSGKDGDDWAGGGDWNEEAHCQVTVRNLSYKQAFSRMFVMLHDEYVTNLFPLYEFGGNPTKEMCDLTQNLNGNGLQAFFNGRPGVNSAFLTSDYFTIDGGNSNPTLYLDGGSIFKFMIRSDSAFMSLAAGFPFANDGGIALQAAPVYNGAEYYLPAIDSGCEANLQTCWSVPASQEDFQQHAPRANCADESLSDTNNNDFSGENFVSIHRGLQDLDSNDELNDLALLECDDVEVIGDNDDTRFATYFFVEGYDDDLLLCQSVGAAGLCRFRSDDNFLEFVKSNDDVVGDDDVLVRIARNSEDFPDFCQRIIDINKGLESAFKILEPYIFDFRNPIAHVKIDC